MKSTHLARIVCLVFLCLCRATFGGDPLLLPSPGLPPSQVDDQGRLVEDWGSVSVTLRGEQVAAKSTEVKAARLEEHIPAVVVQSDCGALALVRTLYRAPIFPAGVDVLKVQVKELQGQPCDTVLAVETSVDTQLGKRTARIGGRTVLVLPSEVVDNQPLRDWGYSDESVSLPGWASPAVACDESFRNIRAGMGGVPIAYRFAVAPGSSAQVVLGLCEGHWKSPGQRPLRCRVEGAAEQTVDPVAKWGVNQPGGLVFAARDENGDGKLSVLVRTTASAPDQNPILNAIWILDAAEQVAVDEVLSGRLNETAQYYVDVGGKKDQSIYPAGKLEFPVHLEPGASQEWVFLVACAGSEAPLPERSDWNPATLLRAARDVWRDWPATE